MPTRQPRDENEVAFAGIQELIRRDETRDLTRSNGRSVKHAAAGKLGGLKGGLARKQALSPARRKAIALKAARARWAKKS
jgi:hypothetical protein